MELPEGADIHTDSEYAMKCFLEWGAGWAARSWRKADGKEVLHQDILRPMWETWKRRGNHIRLHHVSAHTGRTDIHSKGNARADALAVASIH
jgi:ribonuclease HI